MSVITGKILISSHQNEIYYWHLQVKSSTRMENKCIKTVNDKTKESWESFTSYIHNNGNLGDLSDACFYDLIEKLFCFSLVRTQKLNTI